MYISKKKTYKILAYCAMSAIFFGSINGGVASAEDETATEEDTSHTEVEEPATNDNSDTKDDSNNTVEVTENTITRNGTSKDYEDSTYRVDGGGSDSFEGNANNNNVTVNGGKITTFLNGGRAYRGNTNNNTVTINGGEFGAWVEGGWATYGDANENKVIINGGTFTGTIIDGGYALRGDTNYNKIIINGGDFKINSNGRGGIYGGYVAGSGNVIGNEITINGGTFEGGIYGGYISGTGYVQDNVIRIYGSPDLSNASIYAASGGYNSGNTIKIYTQGITAKDIGGFENLEFYLQEGTKVVSTDSEGKEVLNPILTLTNPTSSISSNILVYNDGATGLQNNDVITLITTDNTSGLRIGDGEITIAQGISLEYPSYVKKVPFSDSNSNTQSLQIAVGDIGKEPSGDAVLKDQTEELTAAVVDSASLLDSGTERLLEWLPPEGLDYMNSVPTAGFDPFIGMGGSSLKINTGNGTKLTNKGGGINFGMSRYLKNRHGTFIVAPIIDYGKDEYDSTLPDANGTKGSGHSQYTMGGLIARQVNVNGMYYEGSFRYGQIRTDFVSHNFIANGKPVTASYEASTPCYAGHVRVGWRDHISPQNILDVYGMYSLNRVNGFTTKVSTGEDYSFSAVKSGRIRIGARLTREIKERENVYSGFAYIHEFSGETVGEYMGLSTKRASIKGDAGLIELGWQVKPAKNSASMIDTSLSWWVGDRKGFTFSTKLKKDF
ncbi:MAG: autotransporter domain-containing protein [Selenomonadaceae bacterium]|nr:autotransporter domain-containing protein [Selenomonadaceae bacterium]